MRLSDLNKTLLILAIGLSFLVVSAGYALAEAVPTLQLPAGFVDDGAPVLIIDETLLCGNGDVDPGEYCDDGNNINDACSADCSACGTGYTKNPTTQQCEMPTPAVVCGNGRVESGEVCDDGNTVNDACNATCGGCGTGYTLKGNKCTKTTTGGGVNIPLTAKFTTAKVYPIGFNPKTVSTIFTYKVSKDAFVDLKITDEANVPVVTLMENEPVLANKEFIFSWNGTDTNDALGKILKVGKYFYTFSAKASAQAVASDTKIGEVNIIYGTNERDIMLPPDVPINNYPPEDTTGTGPETAIYLVLPLIGYLATSFKKRG